jgi:hypothetical protein
MVRCVPSRHKKVPLHRVASDPPMHAPKTIPVTVHPTLIADPFVAIYISSFMTALNMGYSEADLHYNR